jgi:hypothetical protein
MTCCHRSFTKGEKKEKAKVTKKGKIKQSDIVSRQYTNAHKFVQNKWARLKP